MALPFYLQEPGPDNYSRDDVPYLFVDFETTNLDKGDPRNPSNGVVMCVVRDAVNGVHKVDQQKYPWPKKCVLVAHNAKFELGWFRRLGVDTKNWLVWDTMIAEYVLAGNRKWDLSLDGTCRRRGIPGKAALVDSMMSSGVCPSEIPERLLLARCKRDVESLATLQREQEQLLKADGLMPVFFTRCIVTPVLSEIESQGMVLDEKKVEQEYAKQTQEKARIEQSLAQISGGSNLRSGKQLGELLYDRLGFPEPRDRRGNPVRTQAGARPTDSDTIAALTGKTPEQKEFLKAFGAYRHADSALAKSLEFFKGVCEEKRGVFYANFNQCVTATHRLSSSGQRILVRGRTRGAQFQNLPREYKSLFWSGDEDYVMVEADGMGLEFRVAGELGNDPQVLADIVSGEDVHRYTASIIFGVVPDDVTGKQRTAAKAHTFKPLFSEGNSGTPRERKYYKAFKEKYKALTDEQETWVAGAMRHGSIRLPSGLITYHTLKMLPSGYVMGANQVRNIPIQSFATADIIPVSLVYTFWEMKEQGIDGALVNTVHDSIVGYVRKTDVDKFHKIVVDCFLDRTYEYVDKVYGRAMTVPLGVGFKAGKYWGEGEEIKTSRRYVKHG
jgi:DNA polymerase I-like protein with 3'-5' exonuclease and polymerase domains